MLLSLRFQPDASLPGDTVASAVAQEVVPALRALPGVVAVHLLQQAPQYRDIHDGHRKSGSQDARVSWVLLVEATGPSHAQAAQAWLDGWPGGKKLGFADAASGTYDLLYGVHAA